MMFKGLILLCYIIRGWLIAFTLFQPSIKATKIVYQPKNHTIFTSYHVENVQFLCKFNSSDSIFISWMVNGSSTNFTSRPTFEGDISSSTLTFPARLAYNATRVICTARGIISNVAWFMYQGLLGMPKNVIAESNSSSVTISWIAPFSLDVTGVYPDIWYTVIIHNVTDENNPTVMDCTDCINITDTHYTLTPSHPNPCYVYKFSLIPINGAGRGEHSCCVTSSVNRAPKDFDVIKVTLALKTKQTFTIDILAAHQGQNLLCQGELPATVILHFASMQSESCPPEISEEVKPQCNTVNKCLIKSEVTLGKNCDYTLHLTLRNGAGDTISTSGVSFNTKIVSVEVQEMEGKLTVKCLFRETLSKSCYVKLVSTVNGGFHEGRCMEEENGMETLSEGMTKFSNLLPAIYTVLVYGEMEKNSSCSSIGGDPDYITVIAVNRSAITSTSASDITSPSLSGSNPLCAEGIGIGISLGVVITCLLFVFGLVTVKVVKIKFSNKDKKSLRAPTCKMTLERNTAYELHKPWAKDAKVAEPLSVQNHVYEDLK